MERTPTHRAPWGFILTPLCFNTNSPERKSRPCGEGEGRAVCVTGSPTCNPQAGVGPRLPAGREDGTKDDTVHGPAASV